MSALRTVVPGRPDDFADAAEWLHRIARGDERFGDDAVAARALFDRAWEGEAQEAFRSRADLLIRAADRLGPLVAAIADEVDGLGRSLHATQLGMLALRAEALRGGHAVTETSIAWSATPAEVLVDRDLLTLWERLTERHRQLLEGWRSAQEQAARALQTYSVTMAEVVESLAFGDRAGSLRHRYAETMAGTAVVLRVAFERARPPTDAAGHPDESPVDASMDLVHALSRETGEHLIEEADAAGRPVPKPLRLGFDLANAAVTPLAVAQDLESGESWTQALTSQGAALGAGMVGGAVGKLAGAPAGPVGRIVFAAFFSTMFGNRADAEVDERIFGDARPKGRKAVAREDPGSGAAIKEFTLDLTTDAPAGGRGGR